VAGNISAPTTVTVKIDKTPPNPPTANVSPTPNLAGWNNSTPVTVTFTDNGDVGTVQSGVAGCTSPATLTDETLGTLVNGTCTDVAGNISAPTTVTVKIDLTPPVVTIALPDPITVLLNQAGISATATWSATDGLSGVAGATTGTITQSLDAGAPVGPRTVDFTAPLGTALDNAGNPSVAVTETYTYYVRYNFIGFLPPVDNPPIINTGKAGRTFPIKWQLKDANGNFISDLSVVLYNPPRYRETSSGSAMWYDLMESSTSGSSGLRYDSTSNQFIFTWKTGSTFVNKSYELLLELNDGTVHKAMFRFTK
jgi:hypothetical protein